MKMTTDGRAIFRLNARNWFDEAQGDCAQEFQLGRVADHAR